MRPDHLYALGSGAASASRQCAAVELGCERVFTASQCLVDLVEQLSGRETAHIFAHCDPPRGPMRPDHLYALRSGAASASRQCVRNSINLIRVITLINFLIREITGDTSAYIWIAEDADYVAESITLPGIIPNRRNGREWCVMAR